MQRGGGRERDHDRETAVGRQAWLGRDAQAVESDGSGRPGHEATPDRDGRGPQCSRGPGSIDRLPSTDDDRPALAAARARATGPAGPARPPADAAAAPRRALRFGRAPVPAVVGRPAGARLRGPGRAGRRRGRPRRGRGRRRPHRGTCASSPGWPSGSMPDRRSSTASSWSSMRRGARMRPRWRHGSRDARDGPVAFLALDLLHIDGRSLLGQPLVKRHEALRRVLRPGDEVVAVPAIATEGRALWDAVVAQGVAGVLARQRSSPYLPGVRSRLWRFIAAAPGAVGRDRGAGRGRTVAARRRAGARAHRAPAAGPDED